MAHSVNNDKYHFGLDAEIQKKLAGKWNQEDAAVALKWIGELSGASLGSNFHEALKDGVALCKAMNVIRPGAVGKVNTMKMPFMQRENIVQFLEACKAFGLRESDLFVTQDLFEGDNLSAVVDCIFSLGSQAKTKGFRGPTIGVKFSKGDTSKHIDIPSAGSSSAVTRQSQGSYGYQDPTIQKSIGREIVKTQDVASTAPSRQTQGSYGYQDPTVQKSIGHEIIKSSTSGSTVPSRQTQGSYGYQDNTVQKSIGREIIKIPAPQPTSSTPTGSSIAARRAAFEKK